MNQASFHHFRGAEKCLHTKTPLHLSIKRSAICGLNAIGNLDHESKPMTSNILEGFERSTCWIIFGTQSGRVKKLSLFKKNIVTSHLFIFSTQRNENMSTRIMVQEMPLFLKEACSFHSKHGSQTKTYIISFVSKQLMFVQSMMPGFTKT